MKKSKNTKRALLMSVLSMMLCMAMLIGSTFAWFTDSVTSGRNRITAGNLDVELYHTSASGATEKVGADTKLFLNKDNEAIKWEPGVMIYENFTVKNEGSLALKYKLNIDAVDFNTVTAGTETKSLKDVLKVAFVEGGFTGESRADAPVTYEAFKNFEAPGNLLPDAEKTFGVVIYWEPTANDNDYNLSNGKVSSDNEPLFIDLGVSLVATQDTVESDSFGNDYDENAKYMDVWDGTADDSWYDPQKTTFELTSAEQAYDFLFKRPEKFEGDTITLACDVDLSGMTETVDIPISDFKGTLDGNGHTIIGANCARLSGQFGGGIFHKTVNATIKNLTVRSASVAVSSSGTGNIVGGIVGYAQNTVFENVHVMDSRVAGYGKVGGMVGMVESSCTFRDCSVTNTTLNGVSNVGGIIGNMQAVCTFENTTVSGNQWTRTGWGEDSEPFNGETNRYYYVGKLTRTQEDLVDPQCKAPEEMPETVDGIYWMYKGYYWAGYAKYYCAYLGSSSHDCAIEGHTMKLANSEYCVNSLD